MYQYYTHLGFLCNIISRHFNIVALHGQHYLTFLATEKV